MNPILAPVIKNDRESPAVFNAASLYLEGRVHLAYRAIGESSLSIFGYASSSNGKGIVNLSATLQIMR